MSKFSFGGVVKSFKSGAAATRRQLNKDVPGYVAAREVEFIPFNASGRVGDPTYARLSELTGKAVEREVLSLLEEYPVATGVSVEIGFDAYESFGQYMQNLRNNAGFDYEPRIDHFNVDVSRSDLIT